MEATTSRTLAANTLAADDPRTVEGLTSLQIPFHTLALRDAQTAWRNRDIAPAVFGGTTQDWNDASLVARFAFATCGGDWFPQGAFAPDRRALAMAERYGGRGLGGNGGGARCGNIAGVQVKGLGINPLINPASEVWHRTGCLQLSEAVPEALYATALNDVLPYGGVDTYGVIRTNLPAPGFYRGDRARFFTANGALMLREPLLRPAHFIRAPYFKGSDRIRPLMASDQTRVANALMELDGRLGGRDGVRAFVLRALARNARQLARARLLRVTHGAITASNLTFSGEWLDLSTCSLLPGGQNFRLGNNQPPFLLEPESVTPAFLEMVDGYNKYRPQPIDKGIVEPYFMQCYLHYFLTESPALFGLGDFSLKPVYRKYLQPLTEQLHRMITREQKISLGYPRHRQADDPVISFLAGLFTALAQGQTPLRGEASGGFIKLMQAGFHRYGGACASFRAYVTRSALCVMRRELLRDLLYRNRLDESVHRLFDTGERSAQDFVDFHVQAVRWAFDRKLGDTTTLYQDAHCRIYYAVAADTYMIVQGSAHTRLQGLAELEQALREATAQAPFYDYSDYITDLMAFLSTLSAPVKPCRI